MNPIQDIKTPKPLTRKILSETIKAKYVSMEVFDTFHDYYIKYKHYVNDILSVILLIYDINSQNKVNNQKHKMKLLEIKLENFKNENITLKAANCNLNLLNFSQKTKKKILRKLKITIPNESKILKKDPVFPHSTPINPFTVLDRQLGNCTHTHQNCTRKNLMCRCCQI